MLYDMMQAKIHCAKVTIIHYILLMLIKSSTKTIQMDDANRPFCFGRKK